MGALTLGADRFSTPALRSPLAAGRDLGGVDLRGADLWEAKLRRAGLPFSVYDRNTRWTQGGNPISRGIRLSD